MSRVLRFPSMDRAPAAPDDEVCPSDWGELMTRAQDGDGAAYALLLHQLLPWLRGLAARTLGRGPELEDAVQEILLVLHSIRHTYEPGRPFRPWLATIARRRLIDLLRARSRRPDDAADTDERALAVHPDGADGPAELAESAQRAATVRRAVASLPPRQREAIRRLKLAEDSLDEAARATGQTAGSLKVACHRALQALAGRLHLFGKDR